MRHACGWSTGVRGSGSSRIRQALGWSPQSHNIGEITMARILSAVPLACMAVLGSVAPAASSRHQQPAFSSKADLVRVYATVRDKSGHLITDLQQSDFQVRERGARVPLEVFSAEVQPIRVAIMVDASGSFFERATFQQLRDGLSAFVGQLGPEDRATIGWFSGQNIFVQNPLTSDAAELRRQLDTELQIERVQPELAASLASKDSVAFAFHYRGRPLWNAIGAAAEKLKAEPGQKSSSCSRTGITRNCYQGTCD